MTNKQFKSLIQKLRNIQTSTYIQLFDASCRQKLPWTNMLISATKLNISQIFNVITLTNSSCQGNFIYSNDIAKSSYQAFLTQALIFTIYAVNPFYNHPAHVSYTTGVELDPNPLTQLSYSTEKGLNPNPKIHTFWRYAFISYRLRNAA